MYPENHMTNSYSHIIKSYKTKQVNIFKTTSYTYPTVPKRTTLL